MSLFKSPAPLKTPLRAPLNGPCEILLAGDRKCRGELTDQSAGGFGVLVAVDACISVEDEAELHTGFGHYRVRVAHLTPLREGREDGAAMLRVGCERLAEIPETDPRGKPPYRRRWKNAAPPLRVSLVYLAWALLILGVSAGMMLGMGDLVLSHHGQPGLCPVLLKSDRSVADQPPRNVPSTPRPQLPRTGAGLPLAEPERAEPQRSPGL